MNRPAFEIIEEKEPLIGNILIIDKEGIIGQALVKKLITLTSVIFVSENKFNIYYDNANEKLLLVNYNKNIPVIPAGKYSHIFIIYNGEKELFDSFSSFSKEAEKSEAKLYLVSDLSLNKKNILEKEINIYKNFHLFLYGDLFGLDLYFEQQLNEKTKDISLVNRILYDARKNEKIKVSATGNEELHPVFLEDVVLGIFEVMFGEYDSRIFLMFPKHFVTELHIARQLHKLDPLIKIDLNKIDKYNPNEHNRKLCIPAGKYILGNNYTFTEKIKKAFYEISNEKNLSSPAEEKKLNSEEASIGNNIINYKTSILSASLFIFFVFIFPVLFTLIFAFFGLYQLSNTKEAIEKKDFQRAVKSSLVAKRYFNLAQKSLLAVAFELSFIGKEELVRPFSISVQESKDIVSLLSDVLVSSQKFEDVFNGRSLRSEEDFLVAVNSLKKAIMFYEKASVEKKKFLSFIKADENLKLPVSYVSGITDVFPDIFGFKGDRRYLVLFQNNMELRPGGGFIGSYGVLTLSSGKMKEFSIHDVYEADGKLKGHIEPPFAIRRHLPQVHMYLRDSNFNLDFNRGASTSAYLYYLETGQLIDGIIAVDITFVKNMLKHTGPIYVNDYNETVTAENLYLLTQSHAEKNFFPGSTQKKDFLRALFDALETNLKKKQNLTAIPLVKEIGDSISRKHLLFAFSDKRMQDVFIANGMSSALWDRRETGKTSINDFLGINEANLGVNKANYFIKRKISQDVVIREDGTISEKLTVIYKNSSQKNTWPGGDYKNYIRFILPKDSVIKNIFVDNEEQKIVDAIIDPLIYEKKTFKKPQGLEIEKYEQSGKSVYGFLITAKTDRFTTVSVSYDLKKKFLFREPVNSYNLKLFKQPGTEEDIYSFSIIYPGSVRMVKESNNIDEKTKFEKKEGLVKLSTTFSKDLNLHLDFAKK